MLISRMVLLRTSLKLRRTRMQTIIVFSHLRWDFVFQRPQHLMTRLGKTHRIFFFEEPVHAPGPAPLDLSSPAAGVTVVRPRTALATTGFSGEQLPVLRNLLGELIRSEQLHSPIAWMYTPMALPLLEGLEFSALVYDCMDELSAFLNAPPELLR